MAVIVWIYVSCLTPATIPSKNQPPLLVDPDRVEAVKMAPHVIDHERVRLLNCKS
jgi:hypothetical protein